MRVADWIEDWPFRQELVDTTFVRQLTDKMKRRRHVKQSKASMRHEILLELHKARTLGLEHAATMADIALASASRTGKPEEALVQLCGQIRRLVSQRQGVAAREKRPWL